MAGKRKHSEQYWHVAIWHNRTSQSFHLCPSREGAIKSSYQAFVNGDGFPESITTPDKVTFSIDGKHEETDSDERLTTLWDKWLEQHPGERADWDIGSRTARLQQLEERHVPNPRPFTSEAIVANPDWYRRIYAILGMTDEMFDTLLHVHRFAIADKEAQKLAKDQENNAPRRKRTTAAIYLEGYSTVPDYPVVPLQTQERACRAYCKRMRYKVQQVYRATTPPPEHVPLRMEIGIAPRHAFIYYQHDSKHPYYMAHNLLDARTIDVLVEFTESGPSRKRFGGEEPLNESSVLAHMEVASLWEIDPPTEDERELDELFKRLRRSSSEEESDELLEQVRIVSQRVEAQKPAATVPAGRRAVADVPAVVEKPKVCYVCQIKSARAGSAFCSDACAQAAAERYMHETTRGWCGVCGKWLGSEGCAHSE